MPGKCLFSIKFFLVGKAYLRKADASNHNKKNISTVYYFFFLKSNTFLKALFALIPINKNLECL